MESKTIIEWFLEAKKNGHKWADKAISETIRLRGPERIIQKQDSLEEALFSAFAWRDSEDGEIYWREVKRRSCPQTEY